MQGNYTHTEMGLIELNISNLESTKHFYVDLSGLQVLSQTETSLLLGYQDEKILHLHITPELHRAPSDSAGLYHSAILYKSRAGLANAVKKILQDSPYLYSGSANHLVSEAFYFTDPEGNGVELYYDTDPATWSWQDGKVRMAGEYLDAAAYISLHAHEKNNEGIVPGHIHLKVGNIEEARKFYVEILGFHLTALMPSALFISDGNYHHHMGMNTWESSGAGKREPSLGLRSFFIHIKNPDEVTSLKHKLHTENVGFKEHKNGLTLDDPWGNLIFIT